MNSDDCETMKDNTDIRRVFGPGETPPELAALIVPELDKIIAECKARAEKCKSYHGRRPSLPIKGNS